MMDFSPDYVLGRYLHAEEGIDYVRYPALRPRRILVTFAALNEGGHFNRIRQFWSQDESWSGTEYLFFRDPTNAWYQDITAREIVIRRVAREIGVGRIVFNGSCMGAYAALLAGVRMPASAVFLTALRFPEDTMPDVLREAVQTCPKLPACYIEARGAWPEREALAYVLNAYRDKGGLCCFQSMPESQEHWAIALWNPDFTLRLMDTLENW